MSTQLTIRGVPASIAQDGWWLASETTVETDNGPNSASTQEKAAALFGRPKLIALLVLVALADFLFWSYAPGISAALFAFAIFVAATFDIRPRRALIRPAITLALSALPVMDYVQLLSMSFLICGLIASLIWARKPDLRGMHHFAAVFVFLYTLPSRWFAPFLALSVWPKVSKTTVSGKLPSWRGLLRDWGFPIGGAIVFTGLLADANPVLRNWLSFDVDGADLALRSVFWGGVALMIWPLLDRTHPEVTMPSKPAFRLPGLGLNDGSVLRSLWMFNAILAVQTVLDTTIFLGGATLPDGMSYANYAHRGAYPLLATALLAGLFALAARPFLGQHKLIRPLMLVWLGQNVLLCLSAMLRLDLYIDVYGLTYLRIYAFVWMGFVAIGLSLTAWQAWRGQSNLWLLTRASVAAVATLYAASFINFAQMIAVHNLDNVTFRTDFQYLCDLGDMATPAIRAHGEPGQVKGSYIFWNGTSCRLDNPFLKDWREWGYRHHRVARYTGPVSQTEGAQ